MKTPITRTLALLSLIAAALPVAAAEPHEIVFPRLNATFRDSAPEIRPVSAAGMEILLSSPSNSLTVVEHSALLTPLGDSRHRFDVRVRFLGKAELVANVNTGGAPATLADTVILPTQDVALAGEIEIHRTDSGGYLVTTRELPDEVELAMQSKLGNQLLSMCDLLSILSGVDCSGLVAGFSRVKLPMPPPGESYEVRRDQMTADEHALIEAYLNGAS